MKVAIKAKAKGTIRRKIRKGDLVVFIAGKDYNRYDGNGKRVPHRGKVIEVDPRGGKIKVEGAGIMKKHVKGNRQLNTQSEIKEMEAWIQISNVALIDPESGKPTRVRYQTNNEGEKIRVAVGSGKEILIERSERSREQN